MLDNNTDEDHKDEDSDVDNQDNSTSSPTTSNKKRKYNAVMGMITPGDNNTPTHLLVASTGCWVTS
jgi:hypothetical protein